VQSVTGARAEAVTDCAPRPGNLRSPGPQPCRHVASTLRLSRKVKSLFPLGTGLRRPKNLEVGQGQLMLLPDADSMR
jgi:hypothetical protein